ncbi:hypothetical protein GCM10017786_32410 [Amycolatopsis deserti]|uniref:DUF3618 domain-containing protein n=1 Tax=Amycolatopsis deserti TaxID=185696 RepID=A0ABQ3IYA1_9PSEU|nr:hypothetical protein [Amycolatopsis deserti]GHE97244.1 hypothetical protein GCM10017786_32410 [Amycolatopsis deserti]
MSQQTSSSAPQAVRDQATESAGQVAGTAADQAREVASEAQRQARNLTEQGTDQLREQARKSQQMAAGNLLSIADQLGRMSDSSESGVAQDVVREVAQRAKKVASWLDSREPGDLVGEVRDFARRKPGLFLAGATVAGLLAGRLTRGVAASMSQQGGSAPQPRSPADTPATGYPAEGTYAGPASGEYSGQHRADPS